MKYDKKRKRRKENNKIAWLVSARPENLWKKSIFLSAYGYFLPCRIRRMSLASDAITRLNPLVYHEIVTE